MKKGHWLVLIVLCGVGCRPHERPRNLLLIVIDLLRLDGLGCYGAARDTSPALDAFAREAVRFERAYSSSSWTQPAVASMLTGLYPTGHGLVTLGRRLSTPSPTLGEILFQRNYGTAAVVSHLLLGRRFGFSRGFEHFDQSEGRGHQHVSTPGVTDKAAALPEGLAAREQPFFLFVHYFDPHYSYVRHPAIGFAQPGDGRLRGGESLKQLEAMASSLTEGERRTPRALYDEEIRFTDAGIGRLLDALRRTGRWDETVVAVVSDHGEEFFDHGGIAHGHTLYEELLHVPLLVSAPGAGDGRVVHTPVSTAALAPTLLDLMGVRSEALRAPLASFRGLLDDETDAAPLLAELGGDPPKGRRLGPSHRLRALFAYPWKLVRDERADGLELFDLARDPGEQSDLADRERELARELESRLARHAAELTGLAVAAEEAPIGARDAELLRELGYLAE